VSQATTDRDLERVLGFWGGVAVIVGITIGSGIFRKPHTLARDVGDPVTILGLWVFFGLVSLCGVLALAELSSMLPRTGGAYVFLRAAYGDAAAFVFGWLYLLIATPAAIGALATFFAELLLPLLGLDPAPRWRLPAVASVTILSLTAVNLLGTRLGSAVQTTLTLIKVAALVVVILAAFSLGGTFSHLAPAPSGPRGLGSGAASVIWAYDGWITVSMIAGEVLAPERRMRRIVIYGMLAIVVLYVGANLGYFYAMPVEAMAREVGVPQRIMADLLGPPGATMIGAAILCSVFGAAPALVHAVLGDPDPRRGGDRAGAGVARLRPDHDVLRGRGVDRPALLRGRRAGAAPQAARRRAAVPHAGLSVGPAAVPGRHPRRPGGDRVGRGRPAGAELLAPRRPAHRGGGVPGVPGLAVASISSAEYGSPGVSSS
jgi:amino acid transporter